MYSILSKMPQAHFILQQAPVPPSSSLCRLPLLQCSCSHPFPSVSPFFLLLNVFVQIWNRDEGHFAQSLFLWETECWSLAHPSSARLPCASSFAAWTWQVEHQSIPASTKSCAFYYRFFYSATVCLPAMRPISSHLCFSSSVSVFLPLSEVFDPREPEDPLQPLGPWVNASPTNTPFCTLSYKDMDATPSHKEEPLSWSTLLKEDPYNEQQLNTFNTCT